MKSVSENLAAWMAANKYSAEQVAEKAGVAKVEVRDLLKGEAHPSALRMICLAFNLNLLTACSDNGFKTVSILDVFTNAPQKLQTMVSVCFYRKLEELCDKAGQSGAINIFSPGVGKRLHNGTATLNYKKIVQLQYAMEPTLSKDQFYNLFAKILWSKIPNYNLSVVKDCLKVSYRDLSLYLDTTSSSLGNYGNGVNIPSLSVINFAEKFGLSDPMVFATSYISTKSYNANYKPEVLKKINALKFEKCKDDFVDPPSSEPFVKEDNEVRKPSVPKHIQPEALGIQIERNKVFKMYDKLSDANKCRVDSLIVNLFLDEM